MAVRLAAACDARPAGPLPVAWRYRILGTGGFVRMAKPHGGCPAMTVSNRPYHLIGMGSSPYSLKVRAVLRYRRIPHLWVYRTPEMRAEIAHLRPQVIPALQTPEGDWLVDSTPMIEALERRSAPGRRLGCADVNET